MESERSCVGCRARAPRKELVRVVERHGAAVLDREAILHGRGAWLHASLECLQLALTRRGLERALRVSKLETAVFEREMRSLSLVTE